MLIKTGDSGNRKSKIKIINNEEVIEKIKKQNEKEQLQNEEPKVNNTN